MYVVICVFLILIVGLRYRIGGDSIDYENEFNRIPTLVHLGSFRFESIRWAPGFTLFMIISKSLYPDFTMFQLLHATIVNSIIFWFILHNTRNKFIAICIYYISMYLYFNVEVLRESLAVCMFLLAWPFFRKGQWLFYYLMVIGATFFHVSALFTFLLPCLAIPGVRNLFRLGYKTIFILIILFGISLYIGERFFSMIKLLSMNETINERADVYGKSTTFGFMVLNVMGMLEAMLKDILIPVLALWFFRLTMKNKEGTDEYKAFRKMEILIMANIYISTVALSIIMVSRFSNYLNLFVYVMIASCFFQKVELKKKKRKVRLSSLYWSFIFLVVTSVYMKGYFGNTYGSSTNKRYMLYYPYYSVLDPQEDPRREEILRYRVHIK